MALLCTNYYVLITWVAVINIHVVVRVGGEGLAWVQRYSMCTHVHAQTLDKAGH